jgi:low affinity Fe/Cu permease
LLYRPKFFAGGAMNISTAFSRVANAVARAAGKPWVFALAVLSIVVWLLSGPVFDYSDTWQLIINTSTTIITFLMVFLIQNSQNRDNAAIQVKLDELIRVGNVRNMFVGIENLSDQELDDIRKRCEERAKREADGDDEEDELATIFGKSAEKEVEDVDRKARRAADKAG